MQGAGRQAATRGPLRRFRRAALFSSAATSRAENLHAAADYHRDGFVIVRNAVDVGLLKEFQNHVQWLASRPYLKGVPPDHWHHPIMRNDPFWVRLISDPKLLDIVQQFIGPNIAAFSSHYFCKMPGSTRKIPWHQDGSYYPLWPMNVVSLWLAADRADVENGCLQVIKGSHNCKLELPGGANGTAGMGTHSDAAARKLGEPVHMEMNPGDLSIHHPNLVHCSDANTSSRRRCSLSVRFISTDTHCFDDDQPLLLLRGDAVPGINRYRSWPKYRPGYDMAFEGSGQWNAERYKDPEDEGYFARTDLEQMEVEIRAELDALMLEVEDKQ